MKKTFNINISGFAFTIDEDAYDLLNQYLETISRAFRHQDDCDELVNDLESRIAELLLEKIPEEGGIITLRDVEDVIARVGRPEEMMEEAQVAETITDDNGQTTVEETVVSEGPVPPPYEKAKGKKRLFRDPSNAMLGGVCSGIAEYIGIDPTWVRLGTILLTFASFSTMAIVYIILWLVLPEARTPLDRMEMKGEVPTVHNIGKTVTDAFQSLRNAGNGVAETARSSAPGFCKTIVRVLMIIGLIIALPILAATIIGVIGCTFTLIMFGTTAMKENLTDFFGAPQAIVWSGLVCGACACLLIGTLLWLLVRKSLRPNAPALSASAKWLISLLCVLAFIGAAFSAGRIIIEDIRMEREDHKRWEQNMLDQGYVKKGNRLEMRKGNKTIIIDERGVMIEREEEVTEPADSTVVEKTDTTASAKW